MKRIFFSVFIMLFLLSIQNVFAQETISMTNDEIDGEDVLASEEVEIIPFQEQVINDESPTMENSTEQVDADELAKIFQEDNNQNIKQIKVENNNVKEINYLWIIGIIIAMIPVVIIIVVLVKKYFTKNNY